MASVVFSIILVAGAAVYGASQDRGALYSRADAENSLGEGFLVLEAAGGTNILLGVQAFVESTPLACSSATATLSGALATLTDLQESGNLTVTTSASFLPGSNGPDSMPGLYPYNGSVPGDLDVALHFVGHGSLGGATLKRSETHYAHLGLRLASASSDCVSAVASLSGTLAGSRPSNCTEAGVAPVFQGAVAELSSDASAEGFSLSSSFSVSGGGSCRVTFVLFFEESAIQGPGGDFSALFEQTGSALVQTAAGSPTE